jgi:DNA polymerase III subunit epsilon
VSHPVSMVDLVTLPRFAVVDLETSGFSTRWHRILQIGLVTVESDGTVVDEWSTLVKLRWPFQRVGPTHVHGITRRTLKGAPALDDVLAEFGDRLDGAVLTAHNADFDSGFLRRAARRRPADDPIRRSLERPLCTLRMSRRLDPDRQRSHRVGDLCEFYGVALDKPHDALADATATAAILPHLLTALDIHEVDGLEPYYRPAR